MASKKQSEPIAPAYTDPPAHLSARAAELWRELGPKAATLSGRRASFQAALEFLDRAEEARPIVADEGLRAKTDTGALVVHAMLRVELESRDRFAKIWHQLGLDMPQSPLDVLTREVR